MLVLAHPIASHQIALILQRSGTGQQLPSRLTGFRPIGHQYDDIVVQGVGITTPTRKAQVVAGEQQHTPSGILDNGVFLTRCVEFVLVTIGEQMVFVIVDHAAVSSVDKIMAVTERTVLQFYCQTARNGTMVMRCCFLHPQQCRISGFVGSNAMRLRGKTRAPHLGQHIQIAALCFREQSASLTDILFRLCPADIGLQKCNFQYSSNLTDDFPLNDTIWSMR